MPGGAFFWSGCPGHRHIHHDRVVRLEGDPHHGGEQVQRLKRIPAQPKPRATMAKSAGDSPCRATAIAAAAASDEEARGDAVRLPDGSLVPRLPASRTGSAQHHAYVNDGEGIARFIHKIVT